MRSWPYSPALPTASWFFMFQNDLCILTKAGVVVSSFRRHWGQAVPGNLLAAIHVHSNYAFHQSSLSHSVFAMSQVFASWLLLYCFCYLFSIWSVSILWLQVFLWHFLVAESSSALCQNSLNSGGKTEKGNCSVKGQIR